MRVSIPSPWYRHVNCEYEIPHTGLACGCEQIAHEGTIANHIELKPYMLWSHRFYDFGEGAERDRGDTEWNVPALCRPSRLHLTPSTVHAANSYWPENNRKRQASSEQIRRQIDFPDTLQYPLTQRHLGKIGYVTSQSTFAVSSPIRIIEQETGQPAPGGLTEVSRGSNNHGSQCSRLQPAVYGTGTRSWSESSCFLDRRVTLPAGGVFDRGSEGAPWKSSIIPCSLRRAG